MSRHRVYFRGTRAEVVQLINRVKRVLTGQESDPLAIGKGVFNAIGFAALSDVKSDFITKARGGTGEDGAQWAPLTKAYLAYGRRFGSGEQSRLKKAAGLGKGNRYAPGGQKGLLTASQVKLWNRVFAQTLARLLLSLPEGEAKGRAARIAWAAVKRAGGLTMLDVFGNRSVEILRDTGRLFNSLSPGSLSAGGDYQPPALEGGEEQIFTTLANGVIVGTNVEYAAAHNNGVPAKGIPARPFLPKQIPAVWWDRWLRVARGVVSAAIRRTIEAN